MDLKNILLHMARFETMVKILNLILKCWSEQEQVDLIVFGMAILPKI